MAAVSARPKEAPNIIQATRQMLFYICLKFYSKASIILGQGLSGRQAYPNQQQVHKE